MSFSYHRPLEALGTPAGPLLLQRLLAVRDFLSVALPIANAHTGDFYTRGVWGELVGGSPEAVLAAFSRHHPPEPRQEPTVSWDESGLTKIFCETTHKLVDLEAFLVAAKDHSLAYIGVCTQLGQLLEHLTEKEVKSPDKRIQTDEFMNNKKSHEVLVMSQVIDAIANYCGIKQVIDLGSGKGYLSSFLSMHYDLTVYGIDSSSTNTHGATERNRKLKKYWKVYRTRARADSRDHVSEMESKTMALPDSMECKESINGNPLSKNIIDSAQPQINIDLSPVDSSGAFLDQALLGSSESSNLEFIVQSGTSEVLDSEFPFVNILPIDAVEVVTSPKGFQRVLSEEEKERRKMANMKAKANRLKESSMYLPVTSYITAETELHDVISDLEDSIMVGLHTCGDLAPNTLRIFAAKPEIKAVCSVGCCYHLLSEEFETQAEENTPEKWGFPMCQELRKEGWCCGRNARMSACLALDRVAAGQVLPLESLFYRAVLQVIIKECYDNVKSDRRVGKAFSKSSCFIDYCRESLKNLGLDESKLPDSCLMEYHEMYKGRMKELEAFNMLKVVLSPCIEALILLDRLCYLREQDNMAWSGLVQLFDPVKSPRCYAVIGVKKL
ncbi:probable methyltransferase-like protein 25 isoform X1 [Ambystoma mexicanum]|uniref:probable methyltransferase-like protein 25 isoform X1 n=1 Tax=Ambystoma mexicanum TaxID=8296 RepID=UPI0037E8CBDE